ncbi:MAG: prenyltransferase/squalene oxidase repeat-containing protein [Planctomycetota bacterium]|jgi:squalene-hopene/tetraprenyl-beta-curcumene cyclase
MRTTTLLPTLTTAGLLVAAGLWGCKPDAPKPVPSGGNGTPPAGGAATVEPGIGGVAPAGAVDEATAAKVRAAVAKSQAWLLSQQGEDGSFPVPGQGSDPGVTAIAATALLSTTQGATRESHPQIWKALDNLLAFQKADGAVFDKGNANYCTSVAVLAFVKSGDPAFRTAAQKAADYVGMNIYDETEGADPATDIHYGGAGYGKRKADKDPYADMSNTSYALEALNEARKAGLTVNEKAIKASQKFLARSQHRSESNDQPWVSDDPRTAGGFVYHPAETKNEVIEIDGKKVFLPYGSMTYAGIKSMIYAQVSKDDPRVRAAVDWIKKFWTLEENPGFDTSRDLALGKQGLYYYYDTFAKALHALGEEQITDAKGTAHAWRTELGTQLLSQQQADGSWVNAQDRWMEGIPTLATSYALMALGYVLPAK